MNHYASCDITEQESCSIGEVDQRHEWDERSKMEGRKNHIAEMDFITMVTWK